ncbi:hypothetical protein GCM10011349_42470 [Novosphingobium indicum]|uniref:HTH araC/xylS-type domain-containing protein n=2 Tax=Novosphingobium indicum TaxID=462949 RepID=A0ABQ2JXV2_9SPHN|nr:hypothetical protein GCM10011349_42470 [Novosphingobium indicum]
MPPLTYLSRWRVQLAIRDSRDGQEAPAVLARKLCFSSESTFSNAFKRETGIAPTHTGGR